jgi:hypothetical protein
MATTTLLPLHIGKGRTISEAITDSTDYAENPLKTQKGELVTGYECDPHTADAEFLLSKRQYFMLTGRDQGDRDVIAYHTRQSFKPGEVTPEEANEIGRELALSFTKGRHSFIVATHVDKAHIHNHIIFNSTRLDCTAKFRNFIGSSFAVRRISDRICVEHRLSIVENPKPSRGSYGDWIGDNKPLSNQEKLRRAIDEVLEKKPGSFDAFIAAMEALGYRAKPGKRLSFLTPGAEKFTRCRESTLGADYTEEGIRDRIAGERAAPAHRGGIPQTDSHRPGLLIDIQARLQAGKGPGYERWAKIFNLKQAAQTLIYLQEHGGMDYEELAVKASDVTARYNALSDRMKELEKNLTDNAALQKQIVNYSKTRATYIEYRKAGYSKRFKETHEADILLHQAAKKHFDGLGLQKLPTVASLRADYAVQLEEKRRAYREYQQARDEMKELLVVKANVDRLLDLPESAPDRKSVDRDL